MQMDFPQVKKCTKCGATWLDGQLFWATGNTGSDADLAGLVCDQLEGEATVLCINEQRGKKHGGDTWEKRAAKIDQLDLEMRKKMLELERGLEDQL